MSIDVAAAAKLVELADKLGLGDLLSGAKQRVSARDRFKMRVVAVLIKNMDEAGKADVKKVVLEILGDAESEALEYDDLGG